MIFFQQSASADKGMTRDDLRHGRYDTLVGATLAAVFGCGALIAGAALVGHGGAEHRRVSRAPDSRARSRTPRGERSGRYSLLG